MSGKEINLEEIINKHQNIPKGYEIHEGYDVSRKLCKTILIDFGNKLLELAVENAKCEEGAIIDLGFEIYPAEVDKQSILNTINQVQL